MWGLMSAGLVLPKCNNIFKAVNSSSSSPLKGNNLSILSKAYWIGMALGNLMMILHKAAAALSTPAW